MRCKLHHIKKDFFGKSTRQRERRHLFARVDAPGWPFDGQQRSHWPEAIRVSLFYKRLPPARPQRLCTLSNQCSRARVRTNREVLCTYSRNCNVCPYMHIHICQPQEYMRMLRTRTVEVKALKRAQLSATIIYVSIPKVFSHRAFIYAYGSYSNRLSRQLAALRLLPWRGHYNRYARECY